MSDKQMPTHNETCILRRVYVRCLLWSLEMAQYGTFRKIFFNYSNSTRKVSPNKLLLSEYYLNAQGCDL